MALHELATNAAKHNPNGTQSVPWKILKFVFSWSEKRLASPSTPSDLPASGVGRKLLEQIVPFAFSGAGLLTITESTVDWILTAPLDALCYNNGPVGMETVANAQTARTDHKALMAMLLTTRGLGR